MQGRFARALSVLHPRAAPDHGVSASVSAICPPLRHQGQVCCPDVIMVVNKCVPSRTVMKSRRSMTWSELTLADFGPCYSMRRPERATSRALRGTTCLVARCRVQPQVQFIYAFCVAAAGAPSTRCGLSCEMTLQHQIKLPMQVTAVIREFSRRFRCTVEGRY